MDVHLTDTTSYFLKQINKTKSIKSSKCSLTVCKRFVPNDEILEWLLHSQG